MKIKTIIDINIISQNGFEVVMDSQTIKTFVKDESKIEDLVKNQLQRFLKIKGIDEPILIIETGLEATEYNYSSLEHNIVKNNISYTTYIRVEKEGKEKISFPDYYTIDTEKRMAYIRDFLLQQNVVKVKEDIGFYSDISFLAAIISGDGFKQINHMSNEELEIEYQECLGSSK